MATKKTPSARKSTKPRASSKTKLSLEVVTANQREINGSVYEALDLILDFIGAASIRGGDRAQLDRARAIIDAIPGFIPPGCGDGPYPG
jgi:hypothetical protein